MFHNREVTKDQRQHFCTSLTVWIGFAGAANGMKGRSTHLHRTGESLPSSAPGLDPGLVWQAAMAQMVITLTLECVRKKFLRSLSSFDLFYDR